MTPTQMTRMRLFTPIPTTATATRVQQVISDGTSTETIDYLLDANSGLTQVLGELSDNDDMYYLLGLDVIGGENSDGWSYHHTDGLGSLRAVTDTAESLVSSASYSPYGVPVQNDIVDTSFGFTGEQIDNNGLQYLRARYYSPELGTFLSRDPVFGQVGVAMSMNGYSYAHSNPTNFTDPSGQFVCGGLCIVGAGIAIGATVGALAGGGIDLAAQLATGTDWKCVDWNSVGKSALQGAVLGAVSGGVGAALGIAGAGAVATFGITEGVDFVAGVAMDTLVNDMTLRQAVATNAPRIRGRRCVRLGGTRYW